MDLLKNYILIVFKSSEVTFIFFSYQVYLLHDCPNQIGPFSLQNSRCFPLVSGRAKLQVPSTTNSKFMLWHHHPIVYSKASKYTALSCRDLTVCNPALQFTCPNCPIILYQLNCPKNRRAGRNIENTVNYTSVKFNQYQVQKKPSNMHLMRIFSTSASENKYVLSKNSLIAKFILTE